VRLTASAEADDRDIDLVILGDESLLLGGGDGSGGGEGKKSASGGLI
jgi:hypothetical protein